jgi:GTP diphosphokinase / guanosine-3',5'-bis(diphosphate) 3'-diphosphatase
MINELLDKIKLYNPNPNEERILSALQTVERNCESPDDAFCDAHGVLESILPLNPDDDTVIAILLLGIYLNEDIKNEKIKKTFGQDVVDLLVSVKKLNGLKYSDKDRKSQSEILRMMFVAMARDIRVILIELACRLWKLKNLDRLESEEERVSIAKEALNIYAPVASRLGIYRMKIDIEDLAFKHVHADDHKDLTYQLDRFGKDDNDVLIKIKDRLDDFLNTRGFEAKVSGRMKSTYSIFKKMKKKGFSDIDDLYDIFAMRIVLPSKYDDSGGEVIDDLYGLLGLLHREWRPISRRFKDYIAVPKPNGYRSLHTVILGLAPKSMDKPVEIQIRTEDMHREAEYGVSSHWLYKENKKPTNKAIGAQARWLKGLQDVKELNKAFFEDGKPMSDATLDIFQDRIFVLTPRGEVKDLSVGATPIDFAYAVHSNIGNKCVMAKVDGSVVPLDYELQNGDVVEIITKNDSNPKLQWLSFVKTSGADSKIKAYFSSLNSESNIKEGRKLLNQQLERLGKAPLDQNYSALKNFAGQELNLVGRERLVMEVGKGAQIASDTIRKIYPYKDLMTPENRRRMKDPKEIAADVIRQQNLSLEKMVLVGGESGLPVKMGACCKPKMGNAIVGYVTRGNSVTAHRAECPLLDNLDKSRIVAADWQGVEKSGQNYRVRLKILVVSRIGLIRDITAVISKLNVHIVDMNIKGDVEGLCEDYFTLEIDDLDKFDVLFNNLERVKGVVKVTREG